MKLTSAEILKQEERLMDVVSTLQSIRKIVESSPVFLGSEYDELDWGDANSCRYAMLFLYKVMLYLDDISKDRLTDGYKDIFTDSQWKIKEV